MKINFNNNGKGKHNVSGINRGGYASMIKMRKEQLPEFQKTIQEALEDYSGESICIIIQKEDENGLPSHSHMLMAGVSRMECQIAMGKALSKASDQALEVLLESTKGDVKAMLAIASALTNVIDAEEEK